jgi:hypothetical protein
MSMPATFTCPLVGLSSENVHQRRLPGPRRSHHRDELAMIDFQRHPAQRVHRRGPFPVAPFDVARFDGDAAECHRTHAGPVSFLRPHSLVYSKEI